VQKLVLLVLTASWMQAGTAARDVTFEQRVAAQRELARAAYAHQIGATRPFDEAVPSDLIGRQVANSLRQSRALETIWGVRLTPAMLRGELERMVRNTRMPSRLREMYAVLDDDPVLLLESLARPALVNRLLRARYAFDPAIHEDARRRAELLREHLENGRDPLGQGALRDDAGITRWTARLGERPDAEGMAPPLDALQQARLRAQAGSGGEPGPVIEEAGAFVVRRILVDEGDAAAGSEVIETWRVAKTSFDAWWSGISPRLALAGPIVTADPGSIPRPASDDSDREPGSLVSNERPDDRSTTVDSPVNLDDPNCVVTESWNNGSLDDPSTGPPPRSGHTAVWTGSEVIVWGGDGYGLPGTGERYDPATDTWFTMSEFNAPPGRTGHTAVWTGAEMIVWGGLGPLFLETFSGGARYNPASDTWSPIAQAPEGRASHTAVWTGTSMVVYGGENAWQGQTLVSRPGGFVYRLETNSWAGVPDLGGSAWGRAHHTAVWTGDRMIVWGGRCTSPAGAMPACPVAGDLNNGAAWDPVLASWTQLPSTGAPTKRGGHGAAWTGDEMIVWGGATPTPSATGARFHVGTNTWTAMSNAGAPPAAAGYTITWDGSELIVWGAGDNGRAYDPGTNAWTPLPTLDAPTSRTGHTATWTGTHLVIWGGRTDTEDGRKYARYDPVGETWVLSPATHLPVGTREHTAVWTGNVLLVWGGWETSSLAPLGARYDPALDTWSALETIGSPAPRSRHTAVWTGDDMVVWGGSNTAAVLGTGGRYDPASDTWATLPTAAAPSARQLHTAVWTGQKMVVWGGQSLVQCTPFCSATYFSTGASWSPATNQWEATPATNAPAARSEHAAVWTGSRMLVWGGTGESGLLQSGAAFDPAAAPAAWTALPTTGAPAARRLFTAVWSGREMIVWGGLGVGALSSGGSYDPAAGTWKPTSLTGAPSARQQHSAVWTGKEMIVWGGAGLNSGARYNPRSDRWFFTTPSGAPSGRSEHAAAWTGDQMLVWGGRAGGSHDATGGRYAVAIPQDADDDSFPACAGDCDDADSRVHPGGHQACGDNLNNDCSHPSWPDLAGINESDDDGDTVSECGGDCMDNEPTVYPGAPQLCGDFLNNNCTDPLWPSVANDEADDDLDGFAECSGDCDDTRASVYPGAPEACDGLNSDCLSPTWPDVPPDEVDGDGDGRRACNDCNDAASTVYPAAPQICGDGLNNDCLHPGWPALAGTNEVDDDADSVTECGGDCDDANASVRPGGTQVCGDGLNNNCSSPTWPSLAGTNEADDDLDSHTECAGDCDDTRAAVYPGASEVCDGVTNDCLAPGWPTLPLSERDGDLDGSAQCADCDDTRSAVRPGGTQVCGDGLNNNCSAPGWPSLAGTNEADDDGDGLTECMADCDDAHATVYPGATQICGDGLNNDCNAPGWPSLAGTNEVDNDGDNFLICSGDCDDVDPRVYPGSPEVCDGVNNDCLSPTWPTPPASDLDDDLDGSFACFDCDDQSSAVYPGAFQVCGDNLNNNCAHPSWPSLALTNEADDDGDGQTECALDCRDDNAAIWFGAPQVCGDGLNNDCGHPAYPSLQGTNERDDDSDGQTECAGDCNDASGTVFAGAAQLCDGVNNDCLDPSWPAVPASEQDADGDTFQACAECGDTHATVKPGGTQICGDGLNNNCGHPSWPSLAGTNEVDDDGDGQTECAGDCSDGAASVYLGAAQLCGDGLNNDCGAPGWPSLVLTNEQDDDGDGLTECAGDCDDLHSTVFPGAFDLCDGLNNDCLHPNWPGPTNEDTDADQDGFPLCEQDCDDSNPAVFPLAGQVCGDGLNNDCTHPSWPALTGTNEVDNDGDGLSSCAGDCMDTRPTVYPGAPQVCGDGVNNNCSAPGWPSLAGTGEFDDDGDQVSECAGDCNDSNRRVYPGAPEVCDGLNNNCLDPTWPTPLPNEDSDNDLDGFRVCDGDCNDANPDVAVGMPQICDGLNNDCSMPGWPSLAGTNEYDYDGDGYSVCQLDCNDTQSGWWRPPTEALNLRLITDGTVLEWDPPAEPGAVAVLYDLVRAPDDVTRFLEWGTCEASGLMSTTAGDIEYPYIGGVFYYAVRVINACGQAPAAVGSNGQELPTPDCP
jgi:N-acetylneuraminic acid mutarotase